MGWTLDEGGIDTRWMWDGCGMNVRWKLNGSGMNEGWMWDECGMDGPLVITIVRTLPPSCIRLFLFDKVRANNRVGRDMVNSQLNSISLPIILRKTLF